jgi:hypothetical protein
MATFAAALMLQIYPQPEHLSAAERVCISNGGYRTDLRGAALSRFCRVVGPAVAVQFEPRYLE